MSVNELTRLAFIWAEQDRSAMAQAWPAGSKERAEAWAQVKALRAYRLKRWGKTKMETIMESAKPANALDVLKRKRGKASFVRSDKIREDEY